LSAEVTSTSLGHIFQQNGCKYSSYISWIRRTRSNGCLVSQAPEKPYLGPKNLRWNILSTFPIWNGSLQLALLIQLGMKGPISTTTVIAISYFPYSTILAFNLADNFSRVGLGVSVFQKRTALTYAFPIIFLTSIIIVIGRSQDDITPFARKLLKSVILLVQRYAGRIMLPFYMFHPQLCIRSRRGIHSVTMNEILQDRLENPGQNINRRERWDEAAKYLQLA